MELIEATETMPSPPRDQSCMITDFAFVLFSASTEASRAQLSTVFHMMSTSPLRNAASFAAGSSMSTNFTSRPYFLRYCDELLGSRPLLKTTPGACPAQVLMATTSGRSSFPPPVRLTGETPFEPASRDGSGGAFLSAAKSVEVTLLPPAVVVPLLPAVAHLRTSEPL